MFPIDLTAGGQLDLAKNRMVVGGNHFQLLDEIDPNKNNLVGAAVLHTAEEGKVGCLLRLEPNRDAKVRVPHSCAHIPIDFRSPSSCVD